mmetsp:Transcript_2246/g.6552  ORF Transcript_2246/g.6552 Transcript_2246/m.6552 type:complete len:86 (-) Transcript_2246:176-433(-)
MECLASCMNPGVGPPCTNSAYGSIEASGKNAFELALHSSALRLHLPAVVTGTVVCNSPSEPHSSALRYVMPCVDQALTFAAGKGR